MNSVHKKTIGDPFNAWRGACGFYPPDVVGRQRWLTDGQKRLFERLVRFAGQDGHCFPSQLTLAFELGKSERQIRRDIEALVKVRLIETRRGGRSHSTRYVFLWHPIFEDDRTSTFDHELDERINNRTSVSGQKEDERTRTSCQTGCVAADDRTHLTIRPDTFGNMTGHGCPPNSVQEFSTRTHTESPERQSDKPVKASGRARANQNQNGFKEFQFEYPEPKQHVKVESACRAYIGRIHGVAGEHERLMEGLARYKLSADWQRALADRGGRFIPSMGRFIEDGLYLDHPPAAEVDEAETEYYDGVGGLEEFRRQELGG